MIRAPRVASGIILGSLLWLQASARADIILAAPTAGPADGWEFYTTGRLGAFVEVLKGDGIPQAYALADTDNDPLTPSVYTSVHPVGDGGVRTGPTDPSLAPDNSSGQGPLFASRVRSGFLPNILGFGLRKQLTPRTRLDGFFSIWAATETEGRRTFHANNPDVREAYARIEGPAGTLLVGRALSLFSRGAVQIDFLYGHGFGVGNPAGFDEQGPTAGHIGYGIIAPVFVAGVVYATPKLHGLQLTAGYYDPATTVGIYWGRTKFGRAEGELAYDLESGSFKMHLFASGAWQKVYSLNLAQDPANGNANVDVTPTADVIGGAGGARVEIGRVHLGVAGHRGQGIGVGYFLDGSDANFAKDTTHQLRMFSGAYTQAQVVAGKFDFNAGWGMTWVDALRADTDPNWCNGAMTPCAGFANVGGGVILPAKSTLKQQMGWSGVIVYHLLPNIHIAADYFLSQVKWLEGETQVVSAYNLGTTVTW